MNKPDNPSAFPITIKGYEDQNSGEYIEGHFEKGMTLRDYFAGKALPAILKLEGESMDEKYDPTGFVNSCANISYLIADAMLAERDKS